MVRVLSCAAKMSALEYVKILNELQENLDCNNIIPSALRFDVETSVINGIKLLSGYSTEIAQAAPENCNCSIGKAQTEDSSATSINVKALEVSNLFADQKREKNE